MRMVIKVFLLYVVLFVLWYAFMAWVNFASNGRAFWEVDAKQIIARVFVPLIFTVNIAYKWKWMRK